MYVFVCIRICIYTIHMYTTINYKPFVYVHIHLHIEDGRIFANELSRLLCRVYYCEKVTYFIQIDILSPRTIIIAELKT